MIGRVCAIAQNTFREAVRDRVLYAFFVFAAAVILGSRLLAYVSVGDKGKVVADVGLAAVSVLGVLIAIFIGTGLIHKEIDKRTAYTILSKPVARWEFVLGKYLGLAAVVTVNWLAMSVFFLIYLHTLARAGLAHGEDFTVRAGGLAFALLFVWVEILVVTAVAILFGSATSPVLSAVFTFAAFAAGRLSDGIVRLAEEARVGAGAPGGEHLRGLDAALQAMLDLLRPAAGLLRDLLMAVVPNLTLFDVREAAVHGGALPAGWPWRLVYAAGYVGAALIAASLLFRRRKL